MTPISEPNRTLVAHLPPTLVQNLHGESGTDHLAHPAPCAPIPGLPLLSIDQMPDWAQGLRSEPNPYARKLMIARAALKGALDARSARPHDLAMDHLVSNAKAAFHEAARILRDRQRIDWRIARLQGTIDQARRAPHSDDALLWLKVALEACGMYAHSPELAVRIQRLSRGASVDDHDFRIRLAEDFMRARRPERAAEVLQKVIAELSVQHPKATQMQQQEINRKLGAAMLHLATAKNSLGQFEQSLETASKAGELGLLNAASVATVRAVAFNGLGRPVERDEQLELCSYLQQKVEVCLAMNMPEEAAKFYRSYSRGQWSQHVIFNTPAFLQASADAKRIFLEVSNAFSPTVERTHHVPCDRSEEIWIDLPSEILEPNDTNAGVSAQFFVDTTIHRQPEIWINATLVQPR